MAYGARTGRVTNIFQELEENVSARGKELDLGH
jgi:hypothetical protein